MTKRSIRPRTIYIVAYVLFSTIWPVAVEIPRMQYNVHSWTLDFFDVFLPLLPLVGLCILIFRRSFHRVLPMYAVYVVYSCIHQVVYMLIDPHVFATQAGFFIESITILVQVVLIYSILRRLCSQVPRFLQVTNWLFIAAMGVFVSMAVVSTLRMQSHPGFAQGGIHSSAIISTKLVLCGMILFVLIVKKSFGLAGDNPLLLIVLGFGLVEALDLVIAPIFLYYGIHRLALLYTYEAIAGGTGAVEVALGYLAVLHQAEESSTATQAALEFSTQQLDSMSGAFARLIYKR
ncbi:MAG TPA: hypothetical protein VG759_24835 [Candidatus Angelobacter sp.]|jgi:hypothetical protein|nr:hypothetical protein [Candidatus Angelobacter sp.]